MTLCTGCYEIDLYIQSKKEWMINNCEQASTGVVVYELTNNIHTFKMSFKVILKICDQYPSRENVDKIASIGNIELFRQRIIELMPNKKNIMYYGRLDIIGILQL